MANEDTKPTNKIADETAAKTSVEETPIVEPEVLETSHDDAASEFEEDHHDDTEDMAHGSSLSSMVLTGLVLLTLGGGIALWGGPKIAPHLPAGLSPVAQFLAPGQSGATQQITELRGELDTKFADLANANDTQAAIDAALAAYDSKNAATIQEFEDKLAAADSANIESRLSSIETRMEGVAAQLSTLTDQLADVDLNGGTVDDATAAKIAGYAATIEGLKAELNDVSSKQGSLSQKIDEVSVTSERKVQEAETKIAAVTETANARVANAEVKKAISDLSGAIESGAGFETVLVHLGNNGVEIPQALSNVAQSGVMPMAQLKSDFSPAAHAALKASIASEQAEGVGGKISSFFKSQVTVRSLTPKAGNGTDAILSRVQGALDENDLAMALTELATLNDGAKSAMSDWIGNATARVDAQSALQSISASFDS
ncbi:hypothetical protein GCM10008927_12600 [Amylibacter ulvae]|uniref:Uncharacterized protein n=1 Tax=Paramylibacter ulvae TaxID=1651968 RepID=A0ABQ3CZL4_9RHOB|nr:mitofilin family membrane protein [Amylibacter ulvae]GHA48931.1 hypothetical protein GCM10008927_12600 [Amylibacter ulvae]